MARAGRAYPQVETGAAALTTSRVVACPPDCRVASALRRARLADADIVLLGPRRAAQRRDLERLDGWGLTGLRAADIASHDLPMLSAKAREIDARRLVMSGAPIVLVRDGRRVTGAIDAERAGIASPRLSLARRLEAPRSRAEQVRIAWLRRAGEIGAVAGARLFAVGGFVRDLLLGRASPDLDLAVEGDAAAVARELARATRGALTLHAEFGTASIEGGADESGEELGRIDVASARSERYAQPGALPSVARAAIEVDLGRRDFSVNALALAVGPAEFGQLLDPRGGEADLRRRRLRLLHPLSLVEDPTRIFRAARYASRLGFRLDSGAVRAMKTALEVGQYPALSGQRLRAEVDLLAAEPSGWTGFERLVRWGALALWDREYASLARIPERLRAGRRFDAWARRHRLALSPGDVAMIALLADQRPLVVERCLQRLGARGEPFTQLAAAAGAGPLARRLDRAGARPSDVAKILRPLPIRVLAGAWLHGSRRARRRIEWFTTRGRAIRPLLSGNDVVAVGVPPGPAVGRCLEALRRLRLDGLVKTEEQERAFAAAWRPGREAPLAVAGVRRANRKRGSL